MNILIPMAGMGSRFFEAGYTKPKPFIDVRGKPMIIRVLENLRQQECNFILVARREHLENDSLLVQEINVCFNVTWVVLDNLTEGTACTVLEAQKFIDNDQPLLIANSDQIIAGGIEAFLADAFERKLDGSIMCFEDDVRDPKWSFARINDAGLVIEVKEKEPISNLATVGIYYFRKGSFFVDAAQAMIVKNDRINNEFYTCPVYNYLIMNHPAVGVFLIDPQDMHGLGTPKDLQKYLLFKEFEALRD